MKQKLSELNAYLVENNKKADKYEQYSEQYKELLARQEYMETTFVTQLVAARDKCIDTFKRGSFYKKLPSLIEKGDTILRIDKRKELQETINKDFILLRHSLMTYFDVTDEEFSYTAFRHRVSQQKNVLHVAVYRSRQSECNV